MTASDNDTVSLTVVLSSEHLSDLEVGPILDAIAQQFTAQTSPVAPRDLLGSRRSTGLLTAFVRWSARVPNLRRPHQTDTRFDLDAVRCACTGSRCPALGELLEIEGQTSPAPRMSARSRMPASPWMPASPEETPFARVNRAKLRLGPRMPLQPRRMGSGTDGPGLGPSCRCLGGRCPEGAHRNASVRRLGLRDRRAPISRTSSPTTRTSITPSAFSTAR